MKTSLTTLLAFVAGTVLAPAQGTITIANTSLTYLIETNWSAKYIPGRSNPTTGSATARTTTTANSYFFAVLTQTTGANLSGGMPTDAPSANPFDPAWQDTGVAGKNSTVVRGGITALGNITAAGTWAAPTGPTYATGSVQWYLIVGWSKSYGTTFSELEQNFFVTDGLIGQSPLAYQVSGGGPYVLPPVFLWGNGTGIGGAGLTTGFTLGTITPEPSSLTLAALGAAALLATRRRK